MIQALHILRKDIRHLWPECSIYCLLLAVFGGAAPLTWPGSGSVDPLLQAGIRMLAFLIPLSFFFLIVRVVHEESLVGVNQFWITRPYRWWSLLAAKLLFVFACVLLPFLLMQAWLIHCAGLSVAGAGAGIAHSMVVTSVYALIPYMLVGAITATVTEAFMGLAGMFVAWICFLFTGNKGTAMNMSPPHSWVILAVLFSVAMAGLLIYQYARRRTPYSRIAFAAMSMLFLFLLWGFSGARLGGPIQAVIRSAYPLAAEGSVRLVALAEPLSYKARDQEMRLDKGMAEIKLPARLEGLPADYRIHDPNVSFALEAPGFRYRSAWQTANVGVDVLSFAMPQAVLDRVTRKDVHLHVELLAEELRPEFPFTTEASESFEVPGNGRCSFNGGEPACRYAFSMLVPTQIAASSRELTSGREDAYKTSYATIATMPDGSHIDPIVVREAHFPGKIRPRSKLTFVRYASAGRFRVQLDIPSIDISQYKAKKE